MALFCVCDEAGNCYSSGATAPTTVSFYPYCGGGACHMYAVQEGPDAASLVGASKTYFLVDQYVNDVDPYIHNMDPTLNPQVYIYASKRHMHRAGHVVDDDHRYDDHDEYDADDNHNYADDDHNHADHYYHHSDDHDYDADNYYNHPNHNNHPDDYHDHPDDHYNNHSDDDSCDPLTPSSQVGLTVDAGVTAQAGNTWPVVAQCTNCPYGTRKFWETGVWTNPTDAGANGQKAIGVQCTNMALFCVCDEAGNCYSSGATAPTTVSFYPYCGGGGEQILSSLETGVVSLACHMYAVQEGPDAASLVGASKTYSLVGQYVNDVDPDIHNMDPTLNPQVYIYASKVSCRGCSYIQ
ncbi:hypothetical protein AAVH_41234, partial [Aphelenchoides avenae]